MTPPAGKRRTPHATSLRTSFFVYIGVFIVIALVGAFLSSIAISDLRDQALADPSRAEGVYLYDAASGMLVQAMTITGAGSSNGPDYVLFVQSPHNDLGTVAPSTLPAGSIIVDVSTYRYAADAADGTDEADGASSSPNGIAGLGIELTLETVGDYDAAARASHLLIAPAEPNHIAGASDSAGLMLSPVGYYVCGPISAGTKVLRTVLAALVILVFPLWFGICTWIAVKLFFARRVKPGLAVLDTATTKIAQHDLDFTVSYPRRDELGVLVESFETMRSSLAATQLELMRTADERHSLNAAFAHDLRTPLTVLRGRIEMLQGQLASDANDTHDTARKLDSCRKLAQQVVRLERYVDAMSTMQRLDDRTIVRGNLPFDELVNALGYFGESICQVNDIAFACAVATAPEQPGELLSLDRSVVAEVADNLIGNAARHAAGRVEGTLGVEVDDRGRRFLVLVVTDDGPGFSQEALHRALSPFFTEEKSAGPHFGLGLNIALMLCEKHGGSLELANRAQGGACVTARFGLDG